MVTYWPCSQRLEDLLTDLPPATDRILLCGPYPETVAQYRAYLRDAAMLSGWGFSLQAARTNGRCEAAFFSPEGSRVRVTSAASWFDRMELGPTAVQATMRTMARELREAFHRTAPLPLVSPAVTGMTLWRAEAGEQYPELPEETQTLIRAHSGQGRSEVLTPSGVDRLAEFHYWDMRLAYPSCMEHLPIGPVVHDEEPELPAVGRVRVRFTVPHHWEHVGLLLTKEPLLGMAWPDQPGAEGESWCDAAEARVAIRQGWPLTVLERLVFREGKPLDLWRRRLITLYQRADERGDTALRYAYRAILNQTCADFYGRGRTRVAPVQEVGVGLVDHETSQERRRERDSHPEWSAAVWARCRLRLTRYLLDTPRETLLGCHVDELYCAETPPWARSEQGQAAALGRMRCKGVLLGDLQAPRVLNDLWELKRATGDSHGAEKGVDDAELL